MKTRSIIARLLLAVLPLGITPLLGWLIAEDYIGFGGGEKDIVILIPWLIWSCIYLVAFIVMWVKRAAPKRCVLWSLGIATGALVVIWGVLYAISAGLLGVNKT